MKGKLSVFFKVVFTLTILLSFTLLTFGLYLFASTITDPNLTFQNFFFSLMLPWIGIGFSYILLTSIKTVEITGDTLLINKLFQKIQIRNIKSLEYSESIVETQYGKTRQMLVGREKELLLTLTSRELKNYEEIVNYFRLNNSSTDKLKIEIWNRPFKIFLGFGLFILLGVFIGKFLK